MGRRKKAVKKAVKKKKLVVAKVFKCLFCSSDKSVACLLDGKAAVGKLECGICKAKYRTRINSLSEPIDVFTEWLDATYEANSKGMSANLQIDATGDGFSEAEDDQNEDVEPTGESSAQAVNEDDGDDYDD